MSGVLGHRLARKKIADRRLTQFREILDQLALGVAPREVVVRLREAQLREPVHHLGARERLGQENDIGPQAANLPDQRFPERKWLGMRIVDSEYPHALRDPVFDHTPQLFLQRLARIRLEVEGVDVLVFLGRVFGVLDRPVRTFQEPLGMLANVRMIRRALKRDVHRDLDSAFAALEYQMLEVVDRAQLRKYVLVARPS